MDWIAGIIKLVPGPEKRTRVPGNDEGGESDRNLRADLHHPVRRQLKIARRVVGVMGEEDKKLILPWRHA